MYKVNIDMLWGDIPSDKADKFFDGLLDKIIEYTEEHGAYTGGSFGYELVEEDDDEEEEGVIREVQERR